jgi:class 3 adenylate cyclase
MTRAFELMLAEVHRYEGTVNQFLGDGIMALFGTPIAHEDHARRALHAALGIRKALEEYQEELQRNRGISFQVRQGLNTGLVVVGSIGSDLRMDYTAVGDKHLEHIYRNLGVETCLAAAARAPEGAAGSPG